jgi:hypothetical protein
VLSSEPFLPSLIGVILSGCLEVGAKGEGVGFVGGFVRSEWAWEEREEGEEGKRMGS